jgi:hypothetical protein
MERNLSALRFPEYRFANGYDALILAPNSGLRTPANISLRQVEIVYGGRLGSGYVASPTSTFGKFVLFLPPLTEDGEVAYRPEQWSALLEPYARTAAIGMISLNDTPRGLAAALHAGDFVAVPSGNVPLPPVILFAADPALALIEYADRGNQLPMPGVLGRRLSVAAKWERRGR